MGHTFPVAGLGPTTFVSSNYEKKRRNMAGISLTCYTRSIYNMVICSVWTFPAVNFPLPMHIAMQGHVNAERITSPTISWCISKCFFPHYIGNVFPTIFPNVFPTVIHTLGTRTYKKIHRHQINTLALDETMTSSLPPLLPTYTRAHLKFICFRGDWIPQNGCFFGKLPN